MHTDRSVGLAPIVLVPLVLGAALALAGCSSGGTGPAPTASRTSSASTPAPVASSTPVASNAPASYSTPASTAPASTSTQAASSTGSACSNVSARTATNAAVATLPAPTGLPQVRWDAGLAITSAYQPCAALSAVVVPVEGATASSPVAILLFHDGRYLGTATKAQYPFVPDVARTSDTSIAVTYHWVKPGETDAQSSGRTRATFTWNATAGRVVMAGGVPAES